jgi:hypothetical protein
MQNLGQLVEKIRSKNAGPFWLTIDIFCGSADVFARVQDRLKTSSIADSFQVSTGTIKRFDIAELNVIKFSMPRPSIQGTTADRDMHGASFAQIVCDLQI